MKSKFERLVGPRLEEVEAWARAGATPGDVARRLGMAESTFRGYLGKGEPGSKDYDVRFYELWRRYQHGKNVADDAAENALYKMAIGYEYDEETTEVDSEGHQKTKTVHRTVPPDVKALQFWLRNRRPERWQADPERQAGKPDDERGVIVLQAVDEGSADE